MAFNNLLITLILTGLGSCSGIAEQHGVRERRCFVDEAPRDPAFQSFREDLVDAVVKRDVARLRRSLAEDVQVSLSGATGLAAFEEIHAPGRIDSPVWAELEAALKRGGVFADDGDKFCAPFWQCGMLLESQTAIVLGDRVPAYDTPSREATVVTWLSCDVVVVGGEDLPERPSGYTGNWRTAYLAGRWVFIESRMLADVGEPYLIFAKKDGQWRIVAFMAGD